MGLNEMMFIINTEESKDNVHNIFCVKLFQGGNGSPLGGGVSGPVRNKYLLEKTFMERINDGNGNKRQQVLKKNLV